MFDLFLQLLKVSVGDQDELSSVPTDKQWLSILKLADKQALVGVLFCAIQRLPEKQRPGMQLYFEWMGYAAKIQERNSYMNEKCVEFQRILSENNFNSAILKGQGNCAIYPDKLSRQSGDIDIWLDSPREMTMEFVISHFSHYFQHRRHVVLEYGDDVEVELHDKLGAGNDPFRSRRFIKWFNKQDINDCIPVTLPNGKNIIVPNLTVNLFFQLEHIYHHLLTYGIGLRQIMDYYYLLKEANDKKLDFSELYNAIGYVGLKKFVSSLMYVLKILFNMDESWMPLPPDENHGRFLLEDILRSGNFGRTFRSSFKKGDSELTAFLHRMGYYARLGWHFPEFAIVRIYCNIKGKFKDMSGKTLLEK